MHGREDMVHQSNCIRAAAESETTGGGQEDEFTVGSYHTQTKRTTPAASRNRAGRRSITEQRRTPCHDYGFVVRIIKIISILNQAIDQSDSAF
jgi:hypothetical protein